MLIFFVLFETSFSTLIYNYFNQVKCFFIRDLIELEESVVKMFFPCEDNNNEAFKGKMGGVNTGRS